MFNFDFDYEGKLSPYQVTRFDKMIDLIKREKLGGENLIGFRIFRGKKEITIRTEENFTSFMQRKEAKNVHRVQPIIEPTLGDRIKAGTWHYGNKMIFEGIPWVASGVYEGMQDTLNNGLSLET